MANEVKIRITSEADTKGFKDANAALTETKVAALVAEGGVKDLNKSMTETDKLGSTFGNKIKESVTRNKVKGEDILPKLNASTFNKFGDVLNSGLGSVSKLAGNHVGITIGAAAGLAAGPVLLSAMGSALAGGVGLGVIGLGVVKAIQKDENLAAAGKTVVEKLNKAITANVDVLNKPIRQVFGQIGKYAEDLQGKLGPVFASLAGSIAPFTAHVIDAGNALTDVLLKKASDSGPAIDALGDGVSMLGDATSKFLDKVVDTSPEAADNLRLVFGVVSDLITQTGTFLGVIESLSKNEWLTGPLLPLLRKHYKDAGDASADLTDDTVALADEMDNAGKAATGQMEALKALSDEMKTQTDPVFALMDGMHKLDVAQTDYEQDLKKFGPTNETTEKSLRKLAKAGIDLESAVGSLGKGFDGTLTPALRNTLHAAGLTTPQIDALERQFKEAKRAGDQFSKNYSASAKVNGISSAQRGIRSITDDLRDFQGVWTATMITNYKTFGKPGSGGGLASGGIKGAASGMNTSGLTWVGERGPELVSLPTGSTVHSSGDSMRMMRQGASAAGMGGGTLIVRAAPGSSRDLMSVIIEGLRYEIDRNGGGSAQRYLGSPAVS